MPSESPEGLAMCRHGMDPFGQSPLDSSLGGGKAIHVFWAGGAVLAFSNGAPGVLLHDHGCALLPTLSALHAGRICMLLDSKDARALQTSNFCAP